MTRCQHPTCGIVPADGLDGLCSGCRAYHAGAYVPDPDAWELAQRAAQAAAYQLAADDLIRRLTTEGARHGD